MAPRSVWRLFEIGMVCNVKHAHVREYYAGKSKCGILREGVNNLSHMEKLLVLVFLWHLSEPLHSLRTKHRLDCWTEAQFPLWLRPRQLTFNESCLFLYRSDFVSWAHGPLRWRLWLIWFYKFKWWLETSVSFFYCIFDLNYWQGPANQMSKLKWTDSYIIVAWQQGLLSKHSVIPAESYVPTCII